tara:strand:+ start:1634 stop:1912 length:279 start_codon:yes stop_codon:yes gene_type:complete
MSDKIYVGSGKEKFDGNLIDVTINLSKIGVCTEQIFEYGTDKYIKLKVAKKRDGEDEYGKTHYIEVDTWKPEPKQEEDEEMEEVKEDGDLPF